MFVFIKIIITIIIHTPVEFVAENIIPLPLCFKVVPKPILPSPPLPYSSPSVVRPSVCSSACPTKKAAKNCDNHQTGIEFAASHINILTRMLKIPKMI